MNSGLRARTEGRPGHENTRPLRMKNRQAIIIALLCMKGKETFKS